MAALHAALYNAADLQPYYTPDQLKPYYSSAQILTSGYTVNVLKAYYTAAELRPYYTPSDLKGIYSDLEILSAGYAVNVLKAYYTATDLRPFYAVSALINIYTTQQILDAAYIIPEILNYYSLTDLHDGNYPLNNIRYNYLNSNFGAWSILNYNFSFSGSSGSFYAGEGDGKSVNYGYPNLPKKYLNGNAFQQIMSNLKIGTTYTISYFLSGAGGYMTVKPLTYTNQIIPTTPTISTLPNYYTCNFTATQTDHIILCQSMAPNTNYINNITGYVSAYSLREANYTISELQLASYNNNDILTAHYNVAELTNLPFTIYDLRLVGYNAGELQASNLYSNAEILSVGYSINELKPYYNPTQLRVSGNYLPAQILSAGYTVAALHAALYNAADLRPYYTASSLINIYTDAEILTAGYPAPALITLYTIAQLRDPGNYSTEQILTAGFSVIDLLSSQYYTLEQIRAIGGYSAASLYGADLTISDLQGAGYTEAQIINTGYSLTDLLTVYTLQQLVNARYNSYTYAILSLDGSYEFYSGNTVTTITNPSTLVSVYMSNAITTINYRAFFVCSNLTSLNIPSSLININTDGGLFYGCTSLTSISVDPDNTAYASINGVLFNKTITSLLAYPAGKSETNYSVPSSVTNIGQWSFVSNVNLQIIILPNIVTSIGVGAFSYTNLTSLKIPSSLRSIGTDAFFSTKNPMIYAIDQTNNSSLVNMINSTEGVYINLANVKNLFTKTQILSAGYLPYDLRVVGYSAADLISFNYTLNELNVGRYNGIELLSTGYYSESDLIALGYTPAPLITETDITITDLIATVSFTQLDSTNITNYAYTLDGTNYTLLSPEQTSGPIIIPGLQNNVTYTFGVIGIGINGLLGLVSNFISKQSRPTISQLILQEATVTQMLKFGYSKEELKAGGVTGSKPTNSEELITALEFFGPTTIFINQNINILPVIGDTGYGLKTNAQTQLVAKDGTVKLFIDPVR